MAGTVEITNDLCWMTQNWIHDNTLEVMAAILKPNEAALATRLLEARTFENGGYLDLRPYDKETLATLSRAADAAQKTFEREGARTFYAPEAYPGFMKRVEELKEMLRAAVVN